MPRPASATDRSCLEAALDLLGRRALSETELRERLSALKFRAEEVGTAIARVHEYGYLDEPAIAERARREAERRRRGPARLRADLERRGVQPREIDRVCRQLREIQGELARSAAAEKFGPPQGLSPSQRRRAFRHLAGRGFDSEVIEEILGSCADAAPYGETDTPIATEPG